MLRPVFVNCFLPSPDSRAVVRAAVEVDELAIDANHGSPHPAVLVHTLGGFVHGVDGSGRLSQIANSVVQRVLVDMVDQGRRLFTVVNLPRNAVSQISAMFVADVPAATGVDATRRTSYLGASRGSDSPSKFTAFRVVAKAIAESLWDNFHSHFKSPLDLVRGVGTAIPIPRLYTLSKRLLAHRIYLMGR